MNFKNYLKSYLILTLIFAFGTDAFAQNSECGFKFTPENQIYFDSIKTQLNTLEARFLEEQLSSRSSTATNSVPIKANIIRRSDGTGGLTVTELNNAITELNSEFAVVGLNFFLCEGINYINSDAFYVFQPSEENALTGPNNINGVINMYFAGSIDNGDPNFEILGYTYLPGGPETVMMNKNYTGIGFNVIPHEMGHFFGLLHTHGNSNEEFGTDELVDGSNCETNGDFLCDTAADPNLLGLVNQLCNYTGAFQDANNDLYEPDPLNIMSYSRNECLTVFSPQQIARIRAINQISRSNLICPSFSPNFTADATLSCEVNLTVNFTDNSVGATSWAWDVDGDDITDYTTQNVTHTYAMAGVFDVALTISDGSVNASKVKRQYINVGAIETNTATIGLSLTLDDNAAETSWEFLDSNNNVLYSGGPYTGPFDPNTTKTETFTINPNACYAFQISDSFGDGICCSSGNGLYELRADDNSLLVTGGDFNFSTSHNFYSGTLSINEFNTQVIELFPNPSSAEITIKSQSLPDYYIIYNTLGQVLRQSKVNLDTELNINVHNLNDGIYFIKLIKENSSQVLSFIKN